MRSGRRAASSRIQGPIDINGYAFVKGHSENVTKFLETPFASAVRHLLRHSDVFLVAAEGRLNDIGNGAAAETTAETNQPVYYIS